MMTRNFVDIPLFEMNILGKPTNNNTVPITAIDIYDVTKQIETRFRKCGDTWYNQTAITELERRTPFPWTYNSTGDIIIANPADNDVTAITKDDLIRELHSVKTDLQNKASTDVKYIISWA